MASTQGKKFRLAERMTRDVLRNRLLPMMACGRETELGRSTSLLWGCWLDHGQEVFPAASPPWIRLLGRSYHVPLVETRAPARRQERLVPHRPLARRARQLGP